MSQNRVVLIAMLVAYCLATAVLGGATGRWSEVIYFLTGLILLWYTWETREVRRATLRQTAMMMRPFLGIEYGDERKIWIHNLGKGVARAVTCHNVILDVVQPGDRLLTVAWKPIDFIPEGQKRELIGEGAFVEAGDEEREKVSERMETWLADFGPRGRSAYEFIIDYADLAGSQYCAVVKVNRGHTEVVKDAELPGRR